MTATDSAATTLPNAASTPQPTSQAARTAARAGFRDRIARPQAARDAAEHDRAVEQFIDQLRPLRRVPRSQ